MEQSLADLLDNVEEHIVQQMKDLPKLKPGDLGLDPRSFTSAWIIDDFYLVIRADERRSAEYYAGFEYINPDYIQKVSDYIIYSGDANRIEEILDTYREEVEDAK